MEETPLKEPNELDITAHVEKIQKANERQSLNGMFFSRLRILVGISTNVHTMILVVPAVIISGLYLLGTFVEYSEDMGLH